MTSVGWGARAKSRSRASVQFGEKWDELGTRIAKAVRAYLKETSPSRTHDLRAAVRRFVVWTDVIPKKKRGGALRAYRKRCRRILRLTSDIRDLDIVRGTLAEYARGRSSPQIVTKVIREREELVGSSLKCARRLRGLRFPGVGVDEGRVGDWLAIGLEELVEAISGLIPPVMGYEGNVGELHALKKELRRFRYMVELIPRREHLRYGPFLRKLEDKVGEIRDCDVVLLYLNHSRESKRVASLMDAERSHRHARYRELVSVYSHAVREGRVARTFVVPHLREGEPKRRVSESSAYR